MRKRSAGGLGVLCLTQGKTPSRRPFAKREAEKKISLMVCATQNIQKPEASETKNALVAPIRAIQAIAFAMVHARGGQMTDPPHRQEESQQQTVLLVLRL